MVIHRGTTACAAVATALMVMAASACGNITATTAAGLSGPAGRAIRIGVSLPLTGEAAPHGQAARKGYQLWASDVNAHGGLLGRPVRLLFRDDGSDPGRTARDYTALISRDRVDLTLAPFSSLLTAAALRVTAGDGYALPAGSAGAPTLYALHSRSLFSTSIPIGDQLQPFVDWVRALPPGQRPATAAYPLLADPFADPPVLRARRQLEAMGIRTVFFRVYPATYTRAQLAADAAAVAAAGPQMVVLGSPDVPTASAFINTWARLRFNPRVLIASGGPEEGQTFIDAVGGNSTGIMVPTSWYRSVQNALSHVMVQDYIARYGGTASAINADVAEAYSAGQVLAAGVTGAGAVSNPRIISWLHAHGVQTVLGPARFSAAGENLDAAASALIFQWQPGARFLQVLPRAAAGTVSPAYPKPPWGT